jgi:hypothetical protein
VSDGRPLEVCGFIDVVYANGSRDSFPLMVGYTLDLAGKMLSKSKAIYLHPSADPFQHYLVFAPRAEAIEKIVLRPGPEPTAAARITAVTFQTQAVGEGLEALPDGKLTAEEDAWTKSHAITADAPDMKQIEAEIRRAHRLE